ncbi:type I-E CRISPR-associated protein Cas5/CasD [Streptomyces sp. NPDC059991]|uniref:type I-E CRISPR-associated protein Cas5/CasD n=1 Tax=Streptomyces sp. NPDC059991 TaxID=3347028 RepID=UPI0036A16F7A
MSGFLMQLGGPLQAWGEHSAFTDRDTLAHPTRSGLIGMIASALGISRAHASADTPAAGQLPVGFARLSHLRFVVRCDRMGTRLRDFHTVGGGYPVHRTVPTAKGTRRAAGFTTIVSERTYLADAVFTIAVTAPGDPDLAAACARALSAPHWPLHLGRRSCPPNPQLLLRSDVPDPVTELTRVPLARPAPRTRPDTSAGPPHEPATVSVRFTADTPLPPDLVPNLSNRSSTTTLNDDPVRLHVHDRVYRSRPAYAARYPLPATLCHGYGLDYLQALVTYLHPGNSPAPHETSTP